MLHWANTSPEQQSFNDVLLENGPSPEEEVQQTVHFHLLFYKTFKGFLYFFPWKSTAEQQGAEEWHPAAWILNDMETWIWEKPLHAESVIFGRCLSQSMHTSRTGLI